MNKALDQANILRPAYVVLTYLPNTDAFNIEIATTDKHEAVMLAHRIGGEVWTVTDTLNLARTAQDDE